MTAAVIILASTVLAMVVPIAILARAVRSSSSESRQDAKEVGAERKETARVMRERDVALLERQTTEAQLQQTAREKDKELAAHRAQLSSLKEALADARETLANVGSDDPDAVDELLRLAEERVAARQDPRSDSGRHGAARLPGDPAPAVPGPGEGD